MHRKKVEMRFAHLKVHHRFERMRLRGLTGARDEFHLAAIAQNLKTLANHLWRPPTSKPAGGRSASDLACQLRQKPHNWRRLTSECGEMTKGQLRRWPPHRRLYQRYRPNTDASADADCWSVAAASDLVSCVMRQFTTSIRVSRSVSASSLSDVSTPARLSRSSKYASMIVPGCSGF